MLSELHIRDLVIVRELQLTLRCGMTVLTGETGTGKSILIDALGLALGDRADATVIRNGAERTEVSAVFDVADAEPARAWLRERQLDADDECVLRRVVSHQGRSKAYVNGRPVPIQVLQELGDALISIHGQHSHHALLRTEHQRALLDHYADHGELAVETTRLYSRWRTARDNLESLQRAAAERATRHELLDYQVNELDELALGARELNELAGEHRRLANVESLQETCQSVLQMLENAQSGSALDLLNRSVSDTARITEIDSHAAGIHQLLQEASIQVAEAATDLRSFAASLESDPQALSSIEQRLGAIQDLARKHRVKPEELSARHADLRHELGELTTSNLHLEALRAEVQELEASYLDSAGRLSRARSAAAGAMGERVSELVGQLGMPGGRVEVSVECSQPPQPGPCGIDRVEILVAANPGQPPRALNKVASGGELSRIGLAINVVTARNGLIPTLIFDEADVGIGGGVAEVVGRLMRRLGEDRQVLCVTHLPQVASQAHDHMLVRKSTQNDEAATDVRRLSAKRRIGEVARMLGGVDITEQTVAHASEMIKHAQGD